uniref:Cyclin C-terminal domain-containing protein n=1 Tax=Arundo donax TaxID=35708 RepID=A0A0A9CSX2_ARUDO
MLPHIPAAAAASRCTSLLIRSLSEPSLLRFDSSVIASSALRCAVLQDHNLQAHVSCHVSRLIHSEHPSDKDADECFKMMKALYASLDLNSHQMMYIDQQWTPSSVIHFQSDQGTVNRSAVSRRLFDRSIPQGSAEDEDSTSSDTTQIEEKVISHK